MSQMNAGAGLPTTETAETVAPKVALDAINPDIKITKNYTRDLMIAPALSTVLGYIAVSMTSLPEAFRFAGGLACGVAAACFIPRRTADAALRVCLALGQSEEQLKKLSDHTFDPFVRRRGTLFGALMTSPALILTGLTQMIAEEVQKPGTYIMPGLGVGSQFIAPGLIGLMFAGAIINFASNHTRFVRQVMTEAIGPIDGDDKPTRSPHNVTPRPKLLVAET